MNAWRMLAPEVHPAPKSTKHPGRAQVVIGGSASETQVLFFTDAEAREWATTGPPPTAKTRSAIPPQPAPEQPPKAADGSATATVDVPPTLPTAPQTAAQPPLPAAQPAAAVAVDDDQAVGLREAHEHRLPETPSLPCATPAPTTPPSRPSRASAAPNSSTASAT